MLLYFQLVFLSSMGGLRSCTTCRTRLTIHLIRCWNVGFLFINRYGFVIEGSNNYGDCGHVWTIDRLQAECYYSWMHGGSRNIYVGFSCWWVDCKLWVLLVVRGIKFGCRVSDSRCGGLETQIRSYA